MPGWALYARWGFIARLDDLSHCLAWPGAPGRRRRGDLGQYGNHNAAMEATNLPVDLLEFPRLNLKFRVKKVDGVACASSVEHKGLVLEPRPPPTAGVDRGHPRHRPAQRAHRRVLRARSRHGRPVRLQPGAGGTAGSSGGGGKGITGAGVYRSAFGGTVLLDRRSPNWTGGGASASAAATGLLPANGEEEEEKEDDGDKDSNASGKSGKERRYFLYPVHISNGFLFTPSLASSLFLLLLRFLDRQYDKVFQMADACVSDTELTQEEAAIFAQLSLLGDDQHPDAHACRLKISLATLATTFLECDWRWRTRWRTTSRRSTWCPRPAA